MAYLDEQAAARDQFRQQLLAGKNPFALGGGAVTPESLGLFQMAPPQGVKVDAPTPMQVPVYQRTRPGTAPEQRQQDNSLSGALDGLLKGGGGIRDMLEKMRQARERTAPTSADRARSSGRMAPQAPTISPQQQIPGLQPPIDATQAPPGAAAARAYQVEQDKSVGPVRGVEKGGAGYQADLDYLSQHGGHSSVVKDGKIVSVPAGTKGAYGDINPEFAARLRAAGEAYEKQTGKAPQYGELTRGEDVQRIYYEDSGHGTKYPAAAPGRSQHQQGTAGDLPSSGFRDWLKAGNQDQYGLHFPVKNDAPHVQMNPAFKGTVAVGGPAGATSPAWDKGPPQQQANTQWAAADKAALPGDLATPPSGTTVPFASTQGGASHGALADQRAPYAAAANANPQLRDSMAAIMLTESSTPAGQQGVAEAMMNRVNSTNRPFTDAMDPAYHSQMQNGGARYNDALKRIQSDPQLKAQLYSLQDKAFGGSNITNLATDYASGGVARNSAGNSTPTFSSPDGQQFFRKDIRPDVHGGANVAATQDWHAKTSAALAKPQASTPAASPPAAPAQPPASQSPAAAPAPAAAATPQQAVPYAGVGGLQDPANEAATTGTAVFDQGAAAVNAIKPPAAPAPQAPAVAPQAPAPPPPPAPPPAPAPAPRPAAAAPAAPPSGIAAAHKLLDTKVIDIVKQNSPADVARVPADIGQQTLRDAMGNTFSGGMIRRGVEQNLGKSGISLQDFNKAYSQPSPGKRSDAGTSGATDFSARSRTPPGAPAEPTGGFVDTVEKTQPQPNATASNMSIQPGGQPKPEAAPPGEVKATLDPGSQPAVQHPDGSISTVRTVGVNVDGKEVNIPTVSPDGKIMTTEEAVQQYRDSGKHLGKFDTPEAAGAAAEALHQQEAGQISQVPQGVQPTMTPEIAKAIVGAVKDQERAPSLAPQPDAQPVLPADVAPPAPGAPGGPVMPAGAPGSMPLPGGGAPMLGAAATQGNPIAMLGVGGVAPVQVGDMSTPLTQGAGASAGPFGLWQQPVPFETLQGWGWGGGPSAGIGDFGGGFSGGGFDFGGGSGFAGWGSSFGGG